MLMDLLCSKCQTPVLSLIIVATPHFTLKKQPSISKRRPDKGGAGRATCYALKFQTQNIKPVTHQKIKHFFETSGDNLLASGIFDFDLNIGFSVNFFPRDLILRSQF